MHTRRSPIAIASLLVLLLGVVPMTRAEVAVETDAFGNYVRTTVLTQAALRQNKIWKILRHNNSSIHPLNPAGDRQGDLLPVVAENLLNHRYPVAAWSRFNGMDYDIAWSRWNGSDWTAISWVSTGIDAGDDYQPSLSFDATGRPYVTWWRDAEGAGSIYVSFFLVTRWSAPIRVSDDGVDSRAPRIYRSVGSTMRVEYRTPLGFESRIIALNGPTTITDDLNPIGNVSVTRTVARADGGSGWPNTP